MKIIGHCLDIFPRTTMFNTILDIGICAEYEQGERIWCHANKEDLFEMLDQYSYLLQEEK